MSVLAACLLLLSADLVSGLGGCGSCAVFPGLIRTLWGSGANGSTVERPQLFSFRFYHPSDGFVSMGRATGVMV